MGRNKLLVKLICTVAFLMGTGSVIECGGAEGVLLQYLGSQYTHYNKLNYTTVWYHSKQMAAVKTIL